MLQYHKYFLQCSTLASDRSEVRTWERQTCFLFRAPSNLVTPLSTHHCRRPAPKLNGCDITPSTGSQSSEQEYSYLTASNRLPSTPYSHNTPQSFSRATRPYIFPSGATKHVHKPLACSQDFLKICFCSATAATNSTLGIIQCWFNYFSGILANTLPRRLSKEMPW